MDKRKIFLFLEMIYKKRLCLKRGGAIVLSVMLVFTTLLPAGTMQTVKAAEERKQAATKYNRSDEHNAARDNSGSGGIDTRNGYDHTK